MTQNERYIVDRDGNRIGVVLEIAEYRALLAALEEVEAIRAYDAAKASDDEAIPFDQAMEEIKRDVTRNQQTA